MYYNWDESHEVYGVCFKNHVKLFNTYAIDLYVSIAMFNSIDNLREFYNNAQVPEHYGFSEEDDAIIIRCGVLIENDTNIIQLGVKNTNLAYIQGTLSHELQHIYQFIMKNKTPLMGNKSKTLYLNALKLKQEQKGKGYSWIIGYLIYYLYNIEITANIQTLWSQINQNADGDYNKALEIFNNSELFNNTRAINHLINIINNNNISQEQINIVQSYLNIPFNKVISILKKGNKRLLNACGKLKTMIENNYNNKSTNENVIKLSHHELKQIIHESIRKIINEI